MTTYYVGPGGSDASAGTSWAARKLTLGGVEALALVARDVVQVGPGVYREKLTIAKSGGVLYNTGTVSVTNGSKTVTGAGTAFTTSSNVLANDVFQILVIASGTDGVTNGTSTFTSAAGNFQAGMVGLAIRINTSGQFIISAVGSATSITIKNPDGSAVAPGTASGLTYNVGPERPYNIASVDSATQLTLDLPWSGPTLTAEAYECWGPITYVGDVSGANTDGVGGSIRLTGSTNDTTTNQTNNIVCTSFNYRTFRGFGFDTTVLNTGCISVTTSNHWIIEDATFLNSGLDSITFSGSTICTVRRAIFLPLRNFCSITYTNGTTLDNIACLVENCVAIGGGNGSFINDVRCGGIFVRNCTTVQGNQAIRIGTNPTVGQGIYVVNCILQNCTNQAITAGNTSTIVEDYNSFFDNASDRTNALVGSNSTTNPALFATYQLAQGYKLPERDLFSYMQLSENAVMRRAAGIYPTPDDLFGIPRPTTNSKCSWGALQFADVAQSTVQAHDGTQSLVIADAGRVQIAVPTTNVSTTLSVYVYREASYAGTNPQMIVKQSGVADNVITDAGASAGWNLLTVTLTPNAVPGWVIVELVSNNTATSGSYNVYFDTQAVA